MMNANNATGVRTEPITTAVGVKETLTVVVVLLLMIARDLGVQIPEDTKLQIVLAVTIVGGALATWYARSRSTSTASPKLEVGQSVNNGLAVVAAVEPAPIAANVAGELREQPPAP